MKPDQLATWFFRLNGFFSIPNFVLHPRAKGGARTDADVAGIRWPYRAEFPDGQGGDDQVFTRVARPYAVIAEVKKGLCAINGPWSQPEKGNIPQVLRDLGLYHDSELARAATELYSAGAYSGDMLFCSLFCVGNTTSDEVARRYPAVPQRTWRQVATFLFNRFQTYRQRKADHSYWDAVGQKLWQIFDDEPRDMQNFEHRLRRHCSLPPA
jgi:hypothetical protein